MPQLIDMARAVANSDVVSKETRRRANELADLLRCNRPWRKVTAGDRAAMRRAFAEIETSKPGA